MLKDEKKRKSPAAGAEGPFLLWKHFPLCFTGVAGVPPRLEAGPDLGSDPVASSDLGEPPEGTRGAHRRDRLQPLLGRVQEPVPAKLSPARRGRTPWAKGGRHRQPLPMKEKAGGLLPQGLWVARWKYLCLLVAQAKLSWQN